MRNERDGVQGYMIGERLCKDYIILVYKKASELLNSDGVPFLREFALGVGRRLRCCDWRWPAGKC
jgi:hypothetical protein